MRSERSNGLGGSGLWLGVAKLWFLVASYAITIALTHLLQPEVYRSYMVVARIIAVPNMVLIYTMLFAVSRPLAAEHDGGFPGYDLIRRRGLKMAAILGGGTSLVIGLAAPALARWQGDEALTLAIRVVAPISLIYAVYAVNVGTLNALRRFRRQALLDVCMATTKSGLTIGVAAAGLGLALTVGGFTSAAMITLLLSIVMVMGARPPRTEASQGRSLAPMADFAGVLVVFTAVVNLLQSADLLILSSFAETKAQEQAAGFYASAMQVALVPFSLMNAVALLVFPLVASIDAKREPARIRSYLSETAKTSIVLLAFMASVGSAAAFDIQALLFPNAYAAAAGELRLLVWGFSGYSLAVTVAWVFNSAKRSRTAVTLVGLPLVVVVGASYALVPHWFTSGAATAVAIAGAVAAVAALVALRGSYGASVPLMHLLKIGAAVSAVEIMARLCPQMSAAGATGKLLVVVKLVVLSGTFLAVAFASRAVTLRQVRELRRAR
jgi:PST family polysaccharide transporter